MWRCNNTHTEVHTVLFFKRLRQCCRITVLYILPRLWLILSINLSLVPGLITGLRKINLYFYLSITRKRPRPSNVIFFFKKKGDQATINHSSNLSFPRTTRWRQQNCVINI